jgi:hypothetical protein
MYRRTRNLPSNLPSTLVGATEFTADPVNQQVVNGVGALAAMLQASPPREHAFRHDADARAYSPCIRSTP